MNLKKIYFNGSELIDPAAEYSSEQAVTLKQTNNPVSSVNGSQDNAIATFEADSIKRDNKVSGDAVTESVYRYTGNSEVTATAGTSNPPGRQSPVKPSDNAFSVAVASQEPDATGASSHKNLKISISGAEGEFQFKANADSAVITVTADGSVSNYLAANVDSSKLALGGGLGGISNYRIDNTSLREIDAEKSGKGDTELCWAATASNMLYWSGWGKNTGSITARREDDLLDYFKSNFTDAPGYMDSALKWFFSGKYDDHGDKDAPKLKKIDGGGFFKSVAGSNYLKVNSNPLTVMDSIVNNLKAGDICGLGIAWSKSGGHAITCWGFSYNASVKSNNKNYYTGLWISDSDDNYGEGRNAPDVIRYCPISWNKAKSGYMVTYQPKTYGFLDEAIGLKRTFSFNVYDSIATEKVENGTQTVFSGGATFDNIIGVAGFQIVGSGGVATGTVLGSGGSQSVNSDGMVKATVINAGGILTVAAGGNAASAAVNTGGTVNVSSGGVLSGSLNIVGGHAVLENAESANTLAGMNYDLSSAKINDVLITVNGGNLGAADTTYSLNLDNAAKGLYILAEGGDLSGMSGKSFTISYNSLKVDLQVGSSYIFADGNKLSINLDSNSTDRLTAAFSADTRPPQAPADLTRTVTGSRVAMDWADSFDADSRIKQYEVRVDNNANFSSPEYMASPVGSTISVSKLKDGMYYWDVRALDYAGNYSSWSTGSSFLVDAAVPSVPLRLSRTVTGNSVALDWSDAKDSTSGVKQYELQVDNNADFSSPEYMSLPAASAASISGLADNSYFWRVRSEDRSGNYSAWTNGAGFVCDPLSDDINGAPPLPADSISGWVGFGDVADLYKITMANAGSLNLNLTNLTGNANLYLLNASGALLAVSAKPGTAAESISNKSLQAGTYFVKIATQSASPVSYTLTHSEDYYPADIAGNSFDSAQRVETGAQVDEWLGFGDKDDYYKFELKTSTAVALNLDGMSSNADLFLYDGRRRLLAASRKNGSAAENISRTLSAGTYYVRATLTAGNSTDYNLNFDIDPAAFSTGSLKLFGASAPLSGSSDAALDNSDPLKKNPGLLAG